MFSQDSCSTLGFFDVKLKRSCLLLQNRRVLSCFTELPQGFVVVIEASCGFALFLKVRWVVRMILRFLKTLLGFSSFIECDDLDWRKFPLPHRHELMLNIRRIFRCRKLVRFGFEQKLKIRFQIADHSFKSSFICIINAIFNETILEKLWNILNEVCYDHKHCQEAPET